MKSPRRLITSARRSIHNDGWGATVVRVRTFVGQRLLHVQPDLTQHRYGLSERLCEYFDYRVAYGPFAGLQLDPQSWWSAADRGGMILGCYEAQVLRVLQSLCVGARSMVDVGAADGYYAVGAVKAGMVPLAFCFEMSPAGQAVIRSNAAANGVADKIAVAGIADAEFLDWIPEDYWNEDDASVFLVDIEGAEFDLLTSNVLERLRKSRIIVELHEAKGVSPSEVDALIERAAPHFQCDVITSGPRDPGAIQELAAWSDDDRWLLMSESRSYDMRWLVMTPTSEPASLV
jgi:hypothetical protein